MHRVPELHPQVIFRTDALCTAVVFFTRNDLIPAPFHRSRSDVEEKSTIFSLEQIECLFKPRRTSSCLPEAGAGAAAEPGDTLFTKFKEEPEELTQLAPTPGDTIITLDFGVCQPASGSGCICWAISSNKISRLHFCYLLVQSCT